MNGFDDTNILVASKHALAVQASGLVIAKSSSHCGSVGSSLKGFGSAPLLYLDRINPILSQIRKPGFISNALTQHVPTSNIPLPPLLVTPPRPPAVHHLEARADPP